MKFDSSASRWLLNQARSVMIVAVIVCAGPVFAQTITATGDHTPTYNETDNPWNVGTALTVGSTSTGSMTVSGAAAVNNSTGRIGNSAGSNGTVTVTGSGAQWNNSADLTVGNAGSGTLSVESGGLVTSNQLVLGVVGSNAVGTATISGAGSELRSQSGVVVGSVSGQGFLTVQDGGIVTSSFGTRIGNGQMSTGTMTVTGNGSVLNNGNTDLTVGLNGNGTLNIEAGGVVTNSAGTIGSGSSATGTVTVNGAGSQWTNTTSLSVARQGNGILNIQAGGFVTSRTALVGSNSSSTGSLTVTGTGSQWNNSLDANVGSSSGGTGTLDILDNASVSVGSNLTVFADGTLNLASGKLDVGTLNLATAGADFNMTGGRLVADSVLGDLIQDGGVLAPGDSPGLTNITGAYTLNSGSIEFELAGLTRGTLYDALDVGGLATLNGLMDINLINGFNPMLGDSFWLIDATSYTGTPTFDFSDAALASGLAWDTSTFLTDGTIFVGAGSASVPEPGTLAMLSLGCIGFGLRRRRTLNRGLSKPG